MIKFRTGYFILTLILFSTEVLIALFINDTIIRPYVGDVLVVILLYCFVNSFLNLPVTSAAILVLLFSYLIETLQYLNIVQHLGLQHSVLARTIIGTYFTWMDILAYTLGILLVLGIEKLRFSAANRKIRQAKDGNVWLFL